MYAPGQKFRMSRRVERCRFSINNMWGLELDLRRHHLPFGSSQGIVTDNVESFLAANCLPRTCAYHIHHISNQWLQLRSNGIVRASASRQSSSIDYLPSHRWIERQVVPMIGLFNIFVHKERVICLGSSWDGSFSPIRRLQGPASSIRSLH